jgi:hypothetical protein
MSPERKDVVAAMRRCEVRSSSLHTHFGVGVRRSLKGLLVPKLDDGPWELLCLCREEWGS